MLDVGTPSDVASVLRNDFFWSSVGGAVATTDIARDTDTVSTGVGRVLGAGEGLLGGRHASMAYCVSPAPRTPEHGSGSALRDLESAQNEGWLLEGSHSATTVSEPPYPQRYGISTPAARKTGGSNRAKSPGAPSVFIDCWVTLKYKTPPASGSPESSK
jgi:hypothetical protein